MAQGPQPIPFAVRELKGTAGRRPDLKTSMHVDPGVPPKPEFLDPAGAAEWDRIVGILEPIRVLTPADLAPMLRYTLAFAEVVECAGKLRAAELKDSRGRGTGERTRASVSRRLHTAMRELWNAEQSLGLSPSARTRIQAGGSVSPSTKTKRFLDY